MRSWLRHIALAEEEISHFKMVHEIILKRGYTLGRERKDSMYAAYKAFPKGGSRNTHLVHKLLIAGLIEARSCERFRLLSEELEDQELRKFYRKLMISEAHHYTYFLKLARKFEEEAVVQEKWKNLLAYEAQLMKDLGKKKLCMVSARACCNASL